jgi:hypothetical protein
VVTEHSNDRSGDGPIGRWLVDETHALSTEQAWDAARSPLAFEDGSDRPPIAVVLRDVTIHDTKKWFDFPAEVRLDALVVTANADEVFRPETLNFPGVRDRTDLPIDENGIGVYLGRPRYFLDLAFIASQGGSDKTLGELLAENADNLGDLLGNVTKLAVAVPQAAAVTGAAAAAAKLSAAALRLLGQLTGKSIGLYRVTWWEHRDRFGLGAHPSGADRYRHADFEFRYEIFEEGAAGT